MRRPVPALVALVLLLSTCCAARASELFEVGAGGSHVSGSSDADLVGIHAAIDFGSTSIASVVARVDFASGDGERLQDLILGARLGYPRGPVRPYLDAGVGIAPGSMSGSGLAAAAGAGVRVAGRGPVGAFAYVRGLSLVNMEDESSLFEWRAGLTFTPPARADRGAGAR